MQISGPTGAFIAVLAGITAQYGIWGLQIATLMAGFILLAMGFAKLGSVIKFIPSPVIVGFTTGIAVIIFVGQCRYFFGLDEPIAGARFHEQVTALAHALPGLDPHTTAIGAVTLLALVAGHRILARVPGLRRVPAPLLALVIATTIQAIFQFPSVATIGTAFGGIPRTLPSFTLPEFSLTEAIELVGPAFAIALLGAIESLLTAVVADGMTGWRHDSNQELIGQGAANILAPLLGGFAATGAIARTATSIRNGASSPLAGIVHAAVLVLVIVVFAPLASQIPLACLAAILFFVAWNMSDMPHFSRLLRKAPRSDKLLLLTTFALTVFVDLVVAVNVGVVIAALLFMRRMAETVSIDEHIFDDTPQSGGTSPDGAAAPPLPRDVLVYRIDGPFFFGAAEKLESTLERMQHGIRTVVFRLDRVPFMDATGMETFTEIVERFQHRHVRVMLCGAQARLEKGLRQAGIVDLVGEHNLCRDLQEIAARIAAA